MINGGLLKQYRLRAGLEIQQAADRLTITKRALFYYETGNDPRLDIFQRMANLYELSPLEVCLVLRIVPIGMVYGDMLKFDKSCALEGKSPGTVLGEFVRTYNALVRQGDKNQGVPD